MITNNFILAKLVLFSILIIFVIANNSAEQTGKDDKTEKNSSSLTGKNPGPDASGLFAPEGGAFSIIVPLDFSKFEKTEQSQLSPAGEKVSVISYWAENRINNNVTSQCSIAYIDYPLDLFDNSSGSDLIDAAITESNSDLPNVRVLKDENFVWDPKTGTRIPVKPKSKADSGVLPGFLGRSVVSVAGTGDNSSYLRFELFIVKPRLYMVMLSYTNKEKFDSEKSRKFFESFRVLTPK